MDSRGQAEPAAAYGSSGANVGMLVLGSAMVYERIATNRRHERLLRSNAILPFPLGIRERKANAIRNVTKT